MENAVECRDEIRLEGLAIRAQAIVSNVGMNMLELGKVLIEAKALVKHGEWQSWVAFNTGMSVRTAQNWMSAYSRYGAKAEIEGLSKTQVWGLLALPEGKEDEFLADHDVREMTTREIADAVAKVRAEQEDEIARLRAEVEEAHRETDEALNRPYELPDDVADSIREKDDTIARYANEIDVMRQANSELLEDRRTVDQALGKAEREARDYEQMLAEAQEESDRLKKELLDMKSKAAQGEGKREVVETMTAPEFARLVKGFVSSVAQMPFMGAAFAAMSGDEVRVYESYLETVADWCRRTAKAIGTVSGTIVEEARA